MQTVGTAGSIFVSPTYDNDLIVPGKSRELELSVFSLFRAQTGHQDLSTFSPLIRVTYTNGSIYSTFPL